MVTHVERRPSAVRTRLAGTLVAPLAVCSVRLRIRPDGVGTPEASSTRAVTSSFA